MNCKYILFFLILLIGCQQKREVNTSFYFWKTVYQSNAVEQSYLRAAKSSKLFVRILDVDRNLNGEIAPVAPIKFKDQIPADLELVPVVFIVNDILKEVNDVQIEKLAKNIVTFVDGKVKQAGKASYAELQIDCDWTATTRLNYFALLEEIKKHVENKVISATLRLHQLKNQEKSGIPPVDKVLLMCYNMGNLRKYGTQNSILEVKELEKYVDKNLGYYPMPTDIGLPLFSWAVVFRNQSYAGISKRLKFEDLQKESNFLKSTNGLYVVKTDLPEFGLYKNDEIRFEASKFEDIKKSAVYLNQHLSNKPINLLFYHLDEPTLKNFKTHELEEINHILR
ncbi:hypothetical protein [Pedobacter xixiisoli]|uniref:Lipoprotein n=1 Tax=Pedobacter xixiisoli TaxID=1476464 RepID=A0A286A7J4_9SPHI|nr:hypothetical protein [Pedobacter xixiisoli]SOD17884.1 hypothetical protein SAMN06297358_2729 [Pedobacter xixiisoli]